MTEYKTQPFLIENENDDSEFVTIWNHLETNFYKDKEKKMLLNIDKAKAFLNGRNTLNELYENVVELLHVDDDKELRRIKRHCTIYHPIAYRTIHPVDDVSVISSSIISGDVASRKSNRLAENNRTASNATNPDNMVAFPYPVLRKENRTKKNPIEESVQGLLHEGINECTFDSICGYEQLKTDIFNNIVRPKLNPPNFPGFKRTGLLLYGPPGTGKTLFAMAIANRLNWTFYKVTPGTLLKEFQGESEQTIHNLFKVAKTKPSVIFFDEADVFLKNRSNMGRNDSTMQNIIAQIFTEMTDIENSKVPLDFLCIMATNYPASLDPSILRRVSVRIEVPLPDVHARLDIAIKKMGNPALDDNLLKMIGSKTEGFNASDMQQLAETAWNHANKRRNEHTRFGFEDGMYFMSEACPDCPEFDEGLHVSARTCFTCETTAISFAKLNDVLKQKVESATICSDDVLYALKVTKSSVMKSSLALISKFKNKVEEDEDDEEESEDSEPALPEPKRARMDENVATRREILAAAAEARLAKVKAEEAEEKRIAQERRADKVRKNTAKLAAWHKAQQAEKAKNAMKPKKSAQSSMF